MAGVVLCARTIPRLRRQWTIAFQILRERTRAGLDRPTLPFQIRPVTQLCRKDTVHPHKRVTAFWRKHSVAAYSWPSDAAILRFRPNDGSNAGIGHRSSLESKRFTRLAWPSDGSICGQTMVQVTRLKEAIRRTLEPIFALESSSLAELFQKHHTTSAGAFQPVRCRS